MILIMVRGGREILKERESGNEWERMKMERWRGKWSIMRDRDDIGGRRIRYEKNKV